jgi:hypothetical protein
VQGIATQLSHTAVSFLTMHFKVRTDPRNPRHARDGLLPVDLLLEDSGTESFFHCAPPATNAASHPLGVTHVRQLLVLGADTGRLPLHSYLAVWAYCALVDARKVVAAMLYLGFPDTYEFAPFHLCLPLSGHDKGFAAMGKGWCLQPVRQHDMAVCTAWMVLCCHSKETQLG